MGQPQEEALLICSHTCLGAGTPLARLRETDGAPSQACFPELRADPALRLLFWLLATP